MCNVQKNLIAIMPILPANFCLYLKNAWMVDSVSALKQVLIPNGHKFCLRRQAAQLSFRDAINFLRTLENIQRVDASIPQYALQESGSGVEKNLLACTVSGEAQVLFFNISGSEFIELYVGRIVARMRNFLARLWSKTAHEKQ
ncbi:hypothetical protein [Candidatus Methylobacter oryzae]|uniref:Uncharacterized protein n=1 Tax=Candidatus Methylobacter oryzae TaxID=2497749 RepID=A0ABY3CG18_9GAMM|nr:hypothetical protein [Candidatus Methylobacter oryzae]TRX02642.1 hypothetical protein EKO24_002415 [Candidatus Methylobacter oryzae]